MKRRTLLQHSAALPLLGLLTACGGSGPSDDLPSTAQTTLLVYLVASDLLDGSGAERDLLNMLKAHNSANVSVVLQIGGGATAGQYPGIDMQETRRYRLVPRPGTAEGWALQALPDVQQPPAVAMNLPQTLQDFIQWGTRLFPARQYALALWDHGGGPIHGFGNDKALGGGKALSLADIASALKNAGVGFELIGFDCCLMASLEVASGLAPHGRYLVGSEEVTTGWDWTKVVDFIAANPQARGDALGRAIVDSYKAFGETDPLDFTAYSVSDLGKTAALVQVLDQVALTLQSAIASQGLQAWWAIAVARRAAQDFQSNLFQTDADLVDVKSWIHELAKVDMLPAALVSQFDAAFGAMVVHADGGEDDAYGLMMYFPLYSTLNAQLLAKYRAVPFSSTYHALIDTYTAFAASDQMPYIDVGTPRIEGGVAVADVRTVPRPTLQKALPVLTRPFDEGFCALAVDGMAVSMQAATVQDQQIRMARHQLWPMVQGQFVTLLPEDPQDDSLFQIPVMRVDGNREDNGLLMAMRESDGRLRIRWFVAQGTLAGSSAAMLTLSPGEQYQPQRLNLETHAWEPADITLTAPEGDWLVTLQAPPPPVEYYTLHMVASDLTGQLRSSTPGLVL